MVRAFVAAACGFVLMASVPRSAQAQALVTVSLPAVQSATIQAEGPRQGSTGERYLNVEGKDKGKYASFGALRFDGSSLKRDLDKQLGAGKYTLRSVALELAQSNAAFTADGSVKIFFAGDSATDLLSKTLKYPYDPKGGALHGDLLATEKFIKSSPAGGKTTGGQEKTDKNASNSEKTDSCDLSRGESSRPLLEALQQGKMITLVLSEGDPAVAATWAGLKPGSSHKPPTLIVKAARK